VQLNLSKIVGLADRVRPAPMNLCLIIAGIETVTGETALNLLLQVQLLTRDV